MQTKQQALKGAKAALHKINKRDRKHWKISVHENLGWHWRLESIGGFFTLSGGYAGRGNDFACLLSESQHKGCGSINWHDNERFKNPNHAILHTLALASSYLKNLAIRVDLAKTVVR